MSILFWRRLLGSYHPMPATFWGLTTSLWLALLALALALVADVFTTALAISSGQAYEGNPSASFLLQGGLIGLVAFKLFSLLFVYGLARLVVIDGHPRYRFFLALSFYLLAAVFIIVSLSNLMAAFLGDDLFHFLLYLIRYQ